MQLKAFSIEEKKGISVFLKSLDHFLITSISLSLSLPFSHINIKTNLLSFFQFSHHNKTPALNISIEWELKKTPSTFIHHIYPSVSLCNSPHL